MSRSRIDNPHDDVRIHTTPAVIEPGHTFGTVTDKISSIVLRKRTPVAWYIAFAERRLMGVEDRRADLEAGMQRTLERIKAEAERET